MQVRNPFVVGREIKYKEPFVTVSLKSRS